MPVRSEWVPALLKILLCSHCWGGGGPSPASGRQGPAPLPCRLHFSLAGLFLVLSPHLFFGSWPKGHHLWEAFSGHSCLQSR